MSGESEWLDDEWGYEHDPRAEQWRHDALEAVAVAAQALLAAFEPGVPRRSNDVCAQRSPEWWALREVLAALETRGTG